MTKNKLRESVKTPSMTVEFEDQKINTFVYELIRNKTFYEAFKLIFTKAYYNLDFFLNDSLPDDTRVDLQPHQTNQHTDDILNNKIEELTRAVSKIGKSQESSSQTIDSMMGTIEDLLSKNGQLVGALTELQNTMKETKEGLKVLNKLETTGVNITKVIEQNTPIPERPVKELPTRQVPKEPSAPPTSSREHDEVASALGGGLFSNLKLSSSEDSDGEDGEGKLDISAVIAKMRRGQRD